MVPREIHHPQPGEENSYQDKSILINDLYKPTHEAVRNELERSNQDIHHDLVRDNILTLDHRNASEPNFNFSR